MSYFDHPEHVRDYIKMCEGYDGQFIEQELLKFLKPGSSVLELGSGPGNDGKWLQQHFELTLSDYSQAFIEHLKKAYPRANVLQLNAANLKLENPVDCIFSNKVLQHLTPEQLDQSLAQQAKALSPEGIIAHAMWIGEENFELEGEIHYYYRQEELLQKVEAHFDIVAFSAYQEFNEGDSLFFIAQVRE